MGEVLAFLSVFIVYVYCKVGWSRITILKGANKKILNGGFRVSRVVSLTLQGCPGFDITFLRM
jgi:hypothetical protein